MVFEIKDKDLGGRIGVIETLHGKIETPIFLPVVNPVKQERDVPLSDIVNIGFNAIITNAYILYKNYGIKVVEEGIHKFLNFNKVIMTDSGAYQLMRYGSVDVEPKDIVIYQNNIGSDIGVILDIPTTYEVDYDEALFSVNETLKRAHESLEIVSKSKTLWVLPIQGGTYLDLVEYSAKESSKITEYSIYAIGSPVTLLEQYRFEYIIKMIYVTRKHIHIDKPLHLFGAGHPLIIPFAVALGVDMFDSASYILYARDNRLMTLSGTVRLDDIDYLPCTCPVCSRYSVEELKELNKKERTKLLALHNLYMLYFEIQRVKQSIKEGRLWEYLEERARAHPSARRAFNVVIKYADMLEKLDPRYKGKIKALFLYESTSLKRPEILRFKNYIINTYQPLSIFKELILIPGDPFDKPFSKSAEYMKLKKLIGDKVESYGIFFYIPFIGIIPIELSETYPASQFEMPSEVDNEVLNDLIKTIYVFVSKFKDRVSAVNLVINENLQWGSRKFILRIKEELLNMKIKINFISL